MAIAGDVKVRRDEFFSFRSISLQPPRLTTSPLDPLFSKKKTHRPRPLLRNLSLLLQKKVWYRTLKKSVLTPPDSAFGPVWTVLVSVCCFRGKRSFGGGGKPALVAAARGVDDDPRSSSPPPRPHSRRSSLSHPLKSNNVKTHRANATQYIMMGISSVQAFKAGARGLPLVLYGAQLAVRRKREREKRKTKLFFF